MMTKEEAEEKYTTAPHDSPKRAYGRGYLRAMQEVSVQRTASAKRAVGSLTVTDETVEEFLEMARDEGIAAAERWFKRLVKEAMDRAMLGTKEDTRLLLEGYVSDVKAKR